MRQQESESFKQAKVSINSDQNLQNQYENLEQEQGIKQKLLLQEEQPPQQIVIQKDIQQPAAAPKQRLECLDIYRGLTMVGMILVDNMGNSSVIWPLDETEWNGLSTADCVFPSFLFISGMAITLAIKHNGNKKQQFFRILERFVKLFVIGVALNAACANYKQQFRIMGVLQRIAICYFVTSTSYLFLQNFAVQFVLNGVFLLIYIYFMYFFDVPDGCGANNVTPTCNFGRYLDMQIFTLNYMMKPSDPEGLFTTLGALVTTFIGLCYGLALQEFKSQKKRLSCIWFVMSLVLVFIGGICCFLTPINKKVWSPSFVFIVGSMSGAFLNLCFIVVDIYNNLKLNKALEFLKWLGLNPLFVFVAMIWLELIMLLNIHFYVDGTRYSLWNFISEYVFLGAYINSYVASLAVSIFHLLLWIGISYYLYNRKVFIKL
ncbi:heparan-alpha-glucosaminide N-acetyltransferase, putative (macronuclear) [Tetrahymena thermophila SB210]|uniref:Heparan-alpha-glucosaminide N-acetyltransferase, putative n=1 Tax=Tetrahymena thermophila (strain SB210) TaxID=312017 RepID=I7M9K5_TETTS|nr:heparan-alpha-glucosaminide N-acetyltransferase, putative [Tetrahymena thermophila SB210]EAS02013.2 heparan-alpha-glucosaminide N-acetyltransferase, putative [Tetrahymena thermophila SB210]|eukprot:XP_001022258.2 heparan-alpha-glucosaminide N-acetyltransferase, putative [Tetrahymena thermophila SB210]